MPTPASNSVKESRLETAEKTDAAEVRQKTNTALEEKRMVISKSHAISNVNIITNVYELLHQLRVQICHLLLLLQDFVSP